MTKSILNILHHSINLFYQIKIFPLILVKMKKKKREKKKKRNQITIFINKFTNKLFIDNY